MKPKHTKTPFNIKENGIYGDKSEQVVAAFSESTKPTDPEEIANGEFLLRAANSHDELVAACEAVKVIISSVGLRHTSNSFHNNRVQSDCDEALKIIQTALTKAQE